MIRTTGLLCFALMGADCAGAPALNDAAVDALDAAAPSADGGLDARRSDAATADDAATTDGAATAEDAVTDVATRADTVVAPDAVGARDAATTDGATGSTGRVCPPFPAFPDATCVGVPPGTHLTPSGSLTITTNGTVIDALDVAGTITVSATDVVIRRTRVRYAGDHQTLEVSPGASVLVQDCELGRTASITAAQTNANVALRAGSHVTFERVDVYGGADLIKIHSNFTLRDSYLHDPAHPTGSHSDLMQYPATSSPTGFVNISILHNRLMVYSPTSHDNANSALIRATDNEYSRDLLFAENYADGGNYTIQCPNDARNTNVVFRTNRFGRDARYGVASGCTGPNITWAADNEYLDDGSAVLP